MIDEDGKKGLFCSAQGMQVAPLGGPFGASCHARPKGRNPRTARRRKAIGLTPMRPFYFFQFLDAMFFLVYFLMRLIVFYQVTGHSEKYRLVTGYHYDGRENVMPLYLTYPSWLHPEIFPGILPIRWYGLMYIIAALVTYSLMVRYCKQKNLTISKDTIEQFLFFSLLGMIIGARLFGTLVYSTDPMYWQKPWLIFWPFDDKMQFIGLQGFSFHGAAIGIFVGSLIYCRRKRIPYLPMMDIALAAVPLGYTFGRLGNFINSELWGRVTTMPWGVIFPYATPLNAKEPWVQEVMQQTGVKAVDGMVNLPRHPSQLYEAFGEGILLWIILWLFLLPRAPFPGFVSSCYLIGYGFIRFVIEYFRTPDQGIDFPLMFEPVTSTSHLHISLVNFSMGQILCFLMVLSGVILLLTLYAITNKKLLITSKKKQ